VKVKGHNLSFHGAALYYLGAVNLKNKKLRALHPLTWAFVAVAFPMFVLVYGMANTPEMLQDIKDQVCLW
jgi:hypothetical protein